MGCFSSRSSCEPKQVRSRPEPAAPCRLRAFGRTPEIQRALHALRKPAWPPLHPAASAIRRFAAAGEQLKPDTVLRLRRSAPLPPQPAPLLRAVPLPASLRAPRNRVRRPFWVCSGGLSWSSWGLWLGDSGRLRFAVVMYSCVATDLCVTRFLLAATAVTASHRDSAIHRAPPLAAASASVAGPPRGNTDAPSSAAQLRHYQLSLLVHAAARAAVVKPPVAEAGGPCPA